MKTLFRILHAEGLKLKRTLALGMVPCAPLVVVFFSFFVLHAQITRSAKAIDLWPNLTSTAVGVWAVFMGPLFIVLETALINGLEHNSKSWKHIYALPVRGWAVYTAKLLVAIFLLSLSTAILLLGIALAGTLLQILKPSVISTGAVPWLAILKPLLLVSLAALILVAIHTWISIRWESFALSIGVGIAGTFLALFAAAAKLGKYYPWLLPVNTMLPDRKVAALVLGITGGVIIGILGCWEATRRDVL